MMKHRAASLLALVVVLAATASADIFATVDGDRVRVRSGPTLQDDILTHLDTGDRVVVLATPEDRAPWVQVHLGKSDATGHPLTGWMHGRYLRVGLPGQQERRQMAPAAFQTVIRLDTVEDLQGGDRGAVVATVAFERADDDLLRCTIREMRRVRHDAAAGRWDAGRLVAVVPFRDGDGQVWRGSLGAEWAVGDTLLLTPAGLWRRAAAVPGRTDDEAIRARNALGGALEAFDAAQRMDGTWVVSPPLVEPAPGPGHTAYGEGVNRVWKPAA